MEGMKERGQCKSKCQAATLTEILPVFPMGRLSPSPIFHSRSPPFHPQRVPAGRSALPCGCNGGAGSGGNEESRACRDARSGEYRSGKWEATLDSAAAQQCSSALPAVTCNAGGHMDPSTSVTPEFELGTSFPANFRKCFVLSNILSYHPNALHIILTT